MIAVSDCDLLIPGDAKAENLDASPREVVERPPHFRFVFRRESPSVGTTEYNQMLVMF
jgi:hypothetical protein